MKALVVEDEFISRNILLAFLCEHGHCDVAINGREAVEAFDRAYAGGDPYDLVCLDLSMPEMDGHEALRQMRLVEVERGVCGLDRVRIVITTVHWNAESMFHAFRGECDGYLAKPVSKHALDDMLASLNVAVR